MLILRASEDVEVCETRLIGQVAEMYNLALEERDMSGPEDLVSLAMEPSRKWDLVYACGHGNHEGIGDRAGPRFVLWSDLAAALCNHLNEDAWFFLGCCRSGLEQVAFAMFCGCTTLGYVFGPSWEASDRQLACAFHTLLHNFEDRRVEPIRSAKRASEAIDLTIRGFDRGEITISDAFLNWCEMHSRWVDDPEVSPDVVAAFDSIASSSR